MRQMWDANFRYAFHNSTVKQISDMFCSKSYYLQQVHQPRHLPEPARLFGPDYLEVNNGFRCLLNDSSRLTRFPDLHPYEMVRGSHRLASDCHQPLHALRRRLLEAHAAFYHRPSLPVPQCSIEDDHTRSARRHFRMLLPWQCNLDHPRVHTAQVPLPYRRPASGQAMGYSAAFLASWHSSLCAYG